MFVRLGNSPAPQDAEERHDMGGGKFMAPCRQAAVEREDKNVSANVPNSVS